MKIATLALSSLACLLACAPAQADTSTPVAVHEAVMGVMTAGLPSVKLDDDCQCPHGQCHLLEHFFDPKPPLETTNEWSCYLTYVLEMLQLQQQFLAEVGIVCEATMIWCPATAEYEACYDCQCLISVEAGYELLKSTLYLKYIVCAIPVGP